MATNKNTKKVVATTTTKEVKEVKQEFRFKEYKPTYQVFAEQMQAGITKQGWELYTSKPVWRITNLKAVVDKLYEIGPAAVLGAAHLKKKSYIQYHYGKKAAEVQKILDVVPVTDRKALEEQGLKAEHLLMVDASAAHTIINHIAPESAKKWFKFESQQLARQCK